MHRPAPRPSYRLIPSRFPPIGLFDTVAVAADLPAVMELAGWTNDRLVRERLGRLPQAEWVFGRPNASVVMAAFLHAAPGGSRFNGPDLGAWYASAQTRTAIAEVGHHLRREAVARDVKRMERTFRVYAAQIEGSYLDVSKEAPVLLEASDYAASQAFGEAARARGEDGLVYPSVRHAGDENVCAYRPRKVLDVVQAEHFAISVERDVSRIEARILSA